LHHRTFFARAIDFFLRRNKKSLFIEKHPYGSPGWYRFPLGDERFPFYINTLFCVKESPQKNPPADGPKEIAAD
jgi:hypothetical protein